MVAVLVLGFGIVLGACSGNENKPRGTPGGTPGGNQPDPDPGIAAVLSVINQGEIQAGQLAQMKATNNDVKDFAGMDVKDHTEAEQRQTGLYTKLSITRTENSTSRQLHSDMNQLIERERGLMGPAFDKQWIADQVQLHTRAKQTIDKELLPNVQRNELRDEINKFREMINKHLEKATELQGRIGGPTEANPDGGAAAADAASP
jgi:putative membrane protein